MLNVPPLSVLLSQRIVEQIAKATDGETKRIQHLEGEVFALTAKVNDDRIEMLCYDALTILDSPCSGKNKILPFILACEYPLFNQYLFLCTYIFVSPAANKIC